MKIAINGEILEVSGGGALPAGTVAVKPLTQAEYDALTNDEKQADVVYAITDDVSSGGSDGSSSEEIYSTEETRIGTWIDGKPLYRRVFLNVNINATGMEEAILDFPFLIDSMVRCDVYLHYNGIKSYKLPDPYYRIVWNSDALLASRISDTSVRGPSTIILEYTKTTDTGGAS